MVSVATSTIDVSYEIEEVARGLEVPWSIVWTAPNRLLVSERPGCIRIIENGKLLEKPLHTFPEVISQAEEGLMSLAVHPHYSSNKFVYASYAHTKDGPLYVNGAIYFSTSNQDGRGSPAASDDRIFRIVPK
ncbi:MAG: PQQ-dependent sugar dehydrogenase [bacterium]|nr:PQQ-dependent sugar dehydrogenase [bacterium]